MVLSRNLGRSLVKHFFTRGVATSSQSELLSKYPLGLQLHGFSVQNVQPLPEFSLIAVLLKHDRTGSEHLHLDCPMDSNNVFSVVFKTNPPDATGVPHILEHTTLCGSFRYPVRDPFFKMLNRSLSNFMNAMTGHDYTYYPFATTNRKDFDNLMSVYLSSVFEPILSHDDFMQEGWRLEQSDMNDLNSPIVFKGVVYNEMKGQCSNSNYLFWIKFQESIYPSLNNSGGDPAKIIDLRYEDLVDFHRKNYHPSNAKTFTYGNFPLSDHLRTLNDFYSEFGTRPLRLDVKKSLFETDKDTKSHCVVVSGPIDSMSAKTIEEQFKSSITWYLGNPLEGDKHYELFKWKVLSSLLFDGHSAPLYQDLIETGYGEDFSANCGLDQTSALLSFTVGLNNLSKAKVDDLDAKIKDVFVSKVIPELSRGDQSTYHERVLALLHQLELGFKKHKPEFGLNLLNSLVPSWANGSDPLKTLKVETILKKFKTDYANRGLEIFLDMLKSSILDSSTPTFKFVMTPDPKYNENLNTQEAMALENRIRDISEDDRKVLYERNQNLLKKQQKTENVSVLPTLTLSDIPRQGEQYALSFGGVGQGSKLQKRVTGTNDLVYVTATKDLSYIPEKFYKFLPLFNTCLTNLAGTDLTSITELENKIQKLTGGISFSTSAKTDPYNLSKPTLKFVISGMALRDNSNHIYDLWSEILQRTNFSEEEQVVEKLNILVKNLAQNQFNTIADRGHSYANAFGNSQLTPTKKINDLLSGLGQVNLILEMNKKLEEFGKDYLKKEILPILAEIQILIRDDHLESEGSGFKYSVVSDNESVLLNEGLIESFEKKMALNSPGKDNLLSNFASTFKMTKESKTILDFPSQVGYASLAKLGAPYTTKDGATLQVLSQIMTFKHLHSVIREANGAYGGGLNFDGLGGTLNYYSYRDPNAISSTSAFSEAPNIALRKLKEGKWDKKALQEAKLAIFQSVDAPTHISSQGSALFLEGITDEMRQQRRERFLDVTIEDLQEVTEKYLINGENNVFTVLGDASTLNADDTWTLKSI